MALHHRDPISAGCRSLDRRRFLCGAGAAVISGAVVSRRGARWAALHAAEPGGNGRAEAVSVPVRALTRSPGFHWFAYYDKLQFDPTNRYCLGMRVDFEHRSPQPDDAIELGMIDLADGDRWIPLGTSRAWCWQQGCMLQWIPGSQTEVIYNDRDGHRFVSRVLDVRTRTQRTIPHPIYALAPDGRTAVTCNFSRLATLRPGYGYVGVPDPWADQPAPKESGIHRVDLASGKAELIVSLADLAAIPFESESFGNATHWFNHLLVAPDGKRFVFLNRWRSGKSWRTRMVTARLDGGDLRIVNPWGMTSHFIWRDAEHILAWAAHPQHGNGFFLFRDRPDGFVEQIGKGVMTADGHCTYLPGNQWILCDTYPSKGSRFQEVYLYHIADNRKITLGRFASPEAYSGEWRCDTHPRLSRDGRWVTIDSPHEGGRQIYLLDISKIVAG